MQSWPPAIYTPPLSPDFPTHGDWLLRVVEMVWRTPEHPSGITLHDWQKALIRHALEVYPQGHPRAGELRYRQYVFSCGRQNGKSVLGAIFGLYGLLREAGAVVVGVASSAEQARIIFDRTLLVINSSPALRKRFQRLTETRGIKSNDGSTYEIKASKNSALQGIPVSVAMVDELHITKPEVWRALQNGTAARRSGIVIGVTTAGDDASALLIDLYKLGERAANGEPGTERFGFACYQAEEAHVPEDDETLTRYLLQANPSLAEGRLDLETAISDVRTMPAQDVTRYRLNRFVASMSAFLPLGMWNVCREREAMPRFTNPVFAVDRTPSWGFATVTATEKIEGVTYTEVVASVTGPSLEGLTELCASLARHNPRAFAMDRYALNDLAKELTRRGFTTYSYSQQEIVAASSTFYAKVAKQEVRHPGDQLLQFQLPHTARKAIGDHYRISRRDSTVAIDAVLSTAIGVYGAETIPEWTQQLF